VGHKVQVPLEMKGKRNIQKKAASHQGMLTILLADDHESVRDFTSRFLVRHGYKVYTARNGKEVLDILAIEEVHVLLLDLMMPEMDGFTLLEHLRERGGRRPYVIVFSALNREADRKAVQELGGDEYLPKPLHMSYVLDRLLSLQSRFAQTEGGNERRDNG
jgi:DNA-binding response OmpR family regulator